MKLKNISNKINIMLKKQYCDYCKEITEHTLTKRYKYSVNSSGFNKWVEDFVFICNQCKKYIDTSVSAEKVKYFSNTNELSDKNFNQNKNIRVDKVFKFNLKNILIFVILIFFIFLFFYSKNKNKSNLIKNEKTRNNYNTNLDMLYLNQLNIDSNLKKYEDRMRRTEDCQREMERYLDCMNDYYEDLSRYTDCLNDNDVLGFDRLCFKPFNTCRKPFCF